MFSLKNDDGLIIKYYIFTASYLIIITITFHRSNT